MRPFIAWGAAATATALRDHRDMNQYKMATSLNCDFVKRIVGSSRIYVIVLLNCSILCGHYLRPRYLGSSRYTSISYQNGQEMSFPCFYHSCWAIWSMSNWNEYGAMDRSLDCLNDISPSQGRYTHRTT